MSVRMLASCVIVFACVAVPLHAAELITNGDFEGPATNMGVSTTIPAGRDSLPDTIPNGWTRWESFWGGGPELAQIIPVANNGPSLPGATAMDFSRAQGGASGDYTVIHQATAIDASKYNSLALSIDANVVIHNLVAGGTVTPAFEWPVMVQIDYTALDNSSQIWRYGWYIAQPGDGSRVNDPGGGLIATYNDMLVQPNTWVANSFNLFNELPQVKTIDRVLVGGTGWDYHGLADNVSLQGEYIPEPASAVLVFFGLGAVASRLRRRLRIG